MCSTQEARLASLRAAIDEVALAAQAAAGEHRDLGELAARLAGLWAMIAELDPGLAARLRGYCPDTSLGARNRKVVPGADVGPGACNAGLWGWARAALPAMRGGNADAARYFPTISTSIVAV